MVFAMTFHEFPSTFQVASLAFSLPLNYKDFSLSTPSLCRVILFILPSVYGKIGKFYLKLKGKVYEYGIEMNECYHHEKLPITVTSYCGLESVLPIYIWLLAASKSG